MRASARTDLVVRDPATVVARAPAIGPPETAALAEALATAVAGLVPEEAA